MKLFRNVLIVVFVIAIVAVGVELIVRKRLDIVEIVVVNETLPPRTKINASHLKTMKMSRHFVLESTVVDKDSIVGLYLKHEHTLLKNQIISKENLESIEEATDSASLMLYKDERVYALKMDVVGTLGASLEIGSKVDVAVQKKREHEYGVIISDVRVIGVKDRNGKDVDDSKVPHVILLALHVNDVNQVLRAEEEGKIVLLAKGYVSNE